MKKYVFLLAIALFSTFTSCKQNAEAEKDGEKKPVETFHVSMELQTNNDVDLILYYKDGTNEWFVDNKTVWYTAKANKDFQKVDFTLPEGSLPIDLRLDIGRNEYKGQEPIAIRYFSMNYKDQSFVITSDNFLTFFTPNQYITFDAATKRFAFKKDEAGNYDPFFVASPAMYTQIANVAMAQKK